MLTREEAEQQATIPSKDRERIFAEISKIQEHMRDTVTWMSRSISGLVQNPMPITKEDILDQTKLFKHYKEGLAGSIGTLKSYLDHISEAVDADNKPKRRR